MVSSNTTRMLVLGVAQLFEPANGYQLRRELLSWDVESWAHINPGSIYSMLGTLTKQGMLERAQLVPREGVRPIAVYSTTEAGRLELRSLVREGLTAIVPFDQTAVYAALSLMVGIFDRGEVIEMLETRILGLERTADGVREKVRAFDATTQAPPHVARLMELCVAQADAEHAWVLSFVEAIRAGRMAFIGEQGMGGWQPAPNDPAWSMVREREQYLAQLGSVGE